MSKIELHETLSYPHEGGCPSCRDARRCNACGGPLDAHRCTNGRCGRCHAAHCTPGGNTTPGHGYGKVGVPARGGAR
jgi:hypothetical protein